MSESTVGNDEIVIGEEQELPAPREITRGALAVDEFDVEKFLNDHSQFQTLRDIHRNVKIWESKLHDELVAVVNENYDDLLNVASSINRGRSQLSTVKTAVERYEKFASSTKAELDSTISNLATELNRRKELAEDEGRALQMIRIFDLIDDIENLLPRISSDKTMEDKLDDTEILARSFTSAVTIAKLFNGHRALLPLNKRFTRAKKQIISELTQVYNSCENPEYKLRLLVARAHVLESTFPSALAHRPASNDIAEHKLSNNASSTNGGFNGIMEMNGVHI